MATVSKNTTCCSKEGETSGNRNEKIQTSQKQLEEGKHHLNQIEAEKNKESKGTEQLSQNITGSVYEFFGCDDGTNILDHILSEHMEMKDTIEEIYSKGSFYEVVGSKIISLFNKKDDVATNYKVKNSFADIVGKHNIHEEDDQSIPLKSIQNSRMEG